MATDLATTSLPGVAEPPRSVPSRMRWWGWGDPGHDPALPSHALAYLTKAVGALPAPRAPVALDSLSLPPSRLDASTAARLREIAGHDCVSDERFERVLHAAGKGYPDLVRLRAGSPLGAPDAVLYPKSRSQLRELLSQCARDSVAVVPFGGGTSVVGGVEPLIGEHDAVIALDMSGLAGGVELDEASLTVTAPAGMRVRELEDELASRSYTLGHFPQSYEYVSIGGCAATRSAGQASTGYGRFEQLVRALKLTAPAGEIDLRAVPASAAGPSVREMIVGSEGTLGTIDELSLRVRRAPVERNYEGVFFADFHAGAQALRELAQRHLAPDVARLSDPEETAVSLALAGRGGGKGIAGRAYLRARGYGGGCLAILGFEGDVEEVALRRSRALKLVRAHGGLPVGGSPGRAWLRSRFAAPYLRDDLLTHGVMVETLETATQWSNLLELHRVVGEAIGQALLACGTPGIVMCHISHLYETGASLYFTFIARQLREEEIAQWQAVKTAASAAIMAGGGTITHHHAVGRDHAPWLEQEIGRDGVRALCALKRELDPTGIMNPGKLFTA
ncbi:MAG TPA: FAD-binding oxidoreductase [Solirubrobacteraceae bacterium]|nr:FAD-binding oxidoreductase [Solirubrobacteraceae bacterium]